MVNPQRITDHKVWYPNMNFLKSLFSIHCNPLVSTLIIGALLFICTGPQTKLIAESMHEFSPPITAATVYPDRALITRTAYLKLNKGRHRLIFKGASPNLDPASLRAFANSKQIIVQGINSHVERRSNTVDPARRKLENRLQSLEKKRDTAELAKKRMHVDLRGIRDYTAYLKRSINQQATGTTSGSAGRWQKALQFLSSRRARLETERQNKDEELRQIGEQMAHLKAELGKIQTARQRSIRIVEITLQALENSSASIGFAYMMRGASWNVAYGIYLKDGQAMVEYYGDLKQQTGEEWRNATLSLSTAQPANGAARRKIYPLSVFARKANPRTTYQNVEKDVEEVENESIPGADAGEDGTAGYATLDAGGNSLLFKIGKRALIQSSRRNYRVTISRFKSIPEDIRHRLAGGQSPAAHFVARLKNTQPYPMLAGSIDVYRNSGFMGRTSLRHTPSGASFLVSFGVDRQVQVKRSISHHREAAGVLSSARIYRTTIRLEVRNAARQSRKLTILERVPVSEAEEIKVKITAKTTPGFKEEQKNSGILKWDLSLTPGEKRLIFIEYEVTVPEEYPGDVYGH